jgi:tetratricopeptide (TPR) repeat protein
MARRYEDMLDSGRQREVLARAEAIARSLPDDELLARVDCATVRLLIDGNSLEQAAARLEEANRAAARVSHPSIEMRVDCLRARAEFLRNGPDRQAARPVLEEARTLLEDAEATRGLAYTATLTDLGYLHFQAGEFQEALELNRLVRESFERNGRGGTLGMVITISNQAQIHYRLGEIRQAAELGRQSLERSRALRQAGPPTPGLVLGYAVPLIRLGQAEEAEQLLKEAAEQARASNSEFWTARTAFFRGCVLLELSRIEESETEFRVAEKHWNLDPSGNGDRLADLDRARAELDLALGRTEQARARITALLARSGFPGRREGPILPAALRTAASIELSAGSPADAERYAHTAIELATAVARDPEQSADVGEALLLLGLAQRAAGNPQSARESFQRATVSLTKSIGADHRLTRKASEAVAAT